MKKTITVLEKGTVCAHPDRLYGYYGWPSVIRLGDGTLAVGASGMRMGHLCFGGKSTLFLSKDNGKTFLGPIIVNDTPLDDRDVGLTALGGQKMLLTWFNLECRYLDHYTKAISEMTPQQQAIIKANTMHYCDEVSQKYAGSLCRMSPDGGVTWEDAHPIPVTSPHGPILLKNGKLLIVGKEFFTKEGAGKIEACFSSDEGKTWTIQSVIPIPEDTALSNFYEPDVVERTDGTLLCHIRYQHSAENSTREPFTIFQSESFDGGNTWTMARDLGCCGSPPQLLLHSSGTLVCVYGRRALPYGESVMLSDDNGKTWDMDIVLDTDAPSSDLGYPCSVELEDGSIYTVYYQRRPGETLCSLLYTRWRID